MYTKTNAQKKIDLLSLDLAYIQSFAQMQDRLHRNLVRHFEKDSDRFSIDSEDLWLKKKDKKVIEIVKKKKS